MTGKVLKAYKALYARYGTNKTFNKTAIVDMSMTTFYKYKNAIGIETVDSITERALTLNEVVEMLNDGVEQSVNVEYKNIGGKIIEVTHEVRYKFTKAI